MSDNPFCVLELIFPRQRKWITLLWRFTTRYTALKHMEHLPYCHWPQKHEIISFLKIHNTWKRSHYYARQPILFIQWEQTHKTWIPGQRKTKRKGIMHNQENIVDLKDWMWEWEISGNPEGPFEASQSKKLRCLGLKDAPSQISVDEFVGIIASRVLVNNVFDIRFFIILPLLVLNPNTFLEKPTSLIITATTLDYWDSTKWVLRITSNTQEG